MNLGPLPGRLIEAGNGMMLVLFGAMTASAICYFVREVRRIRAMGLSAWSAMISMANADHLHGKAAWAIATLCAGLFVRTGDVFWIRHLENHGQEPGPIISTLAPAILIATSFPIVWGSICWMRAVMPLPFGPWAWMVLAVVAVSFGVWMAV